MNVYPLLVPNYIIILLCDIVIVLLSLMKKTIYAIDRAP